MATHSRFRSFLIVGAALAAWLLLFNVLLTSLERSSLLGWLPDRSTGFGFILESKQRVDAALQAYREGSVDNDRPLAVFVGISDVREGVRLELVASAMNDRWQLLGVAGAGLGIAGIDEQASLVINSDLKPDVIILGMSPLQLIDADVFKQVASTESQQRLDVREELRKLVWITRRRADINSFIDRTIHDARVELLGAFGIKAGVDSRSPWRPLLRTLGMERYPAAVLDQAVSRLRMAGADRLSTFKAGNSAELLGDLIRRSQATGANVIVIEMPQNPLLLELLPSESHDLLAARLRQASGDPNLVVLGFAKAIGSDGFIDLVHLNTAGGERFSRMLGAELLTQLSSVRARTKVRNSVILSPGSLRLTEITMRPKATR